MLGKLHDTGRAERITPATRFPVHKSRLRLGYPNEDVALTRPPAKLPHREPIAMRDSQQAYDRIIRPIEDRMIRSIWRIVRHPQDAQDAMQDALLTIWKRWDRVTGHPQPQALVLKICIDAAYDLARRSVRNGRARRLSQLGDQQCDASRTPSEEVSGTEQHAEILRAIHRLSRRQAAATLMRVVQDQSYGQIAAALGCTEATARKHVARARDRLRVSLAHLDPTNARRDRS